MFSFQFKKNNQNEITDDEILIYSAITCKKWAKSEQNIDFQNCCVRQKV